MSSTTYSLFTDSTKSQFSPTNVQDDCWVTEASIPVYSERTFIHPSRSFERRARTCPGLNMLANHGYINRSGREISFVPLVCAIMAVYNLSLPLTLFLTVPGFLIYGRFKVHWAVTASSRSSLSSRRWSIPSMSYTLDLSSLSYFGPGLRIAHRASLVHPDHPSYAPDMTMLRRLLCYAQSCSSQSQLSSPPFSSSFEKLAPTGGLTLQDLASLRVSRESFLATPSRLSNVHEQVALGECALTWLLFSKEPSVDSDSSIPTSYLAQWFGEERLPDGWVRPIKVIGLLDAHKVAGRVKRDMELVNEKKGRAKKARIESNISGKMSFHADADT